jgi:hypothetical protein
VAVDEPVAEIAKGLQPLRDQATELGIEFDEDTAMEELDRRVRAIQSGDPVEISIEKNRGKKNVHPYIQQQIENDKKVRKWKKDAIKEAARGALGTAFVDKQTIPKSALEKLGTEEAQEAIEDLVLIAGASGRAKDLYFDPAKKKIKKVLRRGEMNDMRDYINARRTVEATAIQKERGIDLESPQNAADSQDWLDTEYASWPEDKRARIESASELYWAEFRGILDRKLEAGLINQAGYDFLVEHHRHFSPRMFIDHIDPQTKSPDGTKRHTSGIKKLGKGSTGALVQDPMYLMAESLARAENSISRNSANKSLHTVAADEGNDLVRVKKPDEKLGKNEEVIDVFIDGNKVQIVADKKFADQWDGLPPLLKPWIAEVLQWFSGTKVLKGTATVFNPEFPFGNLPRDAEYAMLVSGEYNPVRAVAQAQLADDYRFLLANPKYRKEIRRKYVENGGLQEYLSRQGIAKGEHLRAITGPMKALGEVITFGGAQSEELTRLAVMHRAMKNGKSAKRATFIARNMLDFSQGGTVTKAADNVVPYLNSAVQGTRGVARDFKTDPKLAALKSAQLVAAGYMLAQMAATIAPQLWDTIPEEEKATKWILPLPWWEADKLGRRRQAYIAIPKDHAQQFISSAGSSAVDALRGKPWKKQMKKSLSSLSPVDQSVTKMPIENMLDAYIENRDNYRGRDVWQGGPVSPHLERTADTPKLATDIADLAKEANIEISPERLTAATSKILPFSNPLVTSVGALYESADNESGRTVVEKVKDTPVLRRFLRFSQPIDVMDKTQKDADGLGIDTTGMVDREARRAVDEERTRIADIRQPLNVQLDKFMSTEQNQGDIKRFIRGLDTDRDEQERLWQKAKRKDPDLKGTLYIRL